MVAHATVDFHSIALLLLAALMGCASALAAPEDDPSTIHLGQSVIDVNLSAVPKSISRKQIFAWIDRAARAVDVYYGRFPVKELTLEISVNAEGHEIHGREFDGRRIEVGLGPDVTPGDLDGDWILTHEMFHLAFPDMGDKHNWMNEGLSTYLEPIVRARIGPLTPEYVWKETVEGLPQGQPEAGDRGLDGTHTWGRTYWGGCMFWLLADVRIREQTHRAVSLQTALRAILDAGGDGSVEWTVAKVIEVGDKATGTHVLRELYDQMARKPLSTDLDALWKNLGVIYRKHEVTFDDSAPLAGIRKAITRPVGQK